MFNNTVTYNVYLYIYCSVPARQGLRRNALAPGSDKTRTRDPLSPSVYILTDHSKIKNRGQHWPVLLRQGEPGTPQYIYAMKEDERNHFFSLIKYGYY